MKMNWNFRDSTTACVPIQPLRLTYREPLKDTRKTVFHRDEGRSKTSARTSKIHLEDFLDRDNVVVQPNYDECTIELRINEFADCTSQEIERNYRQSLFNVKKALPSLETIRLKGQHYFYPENASTDKVRSEVSLVYKALSSVTAEMRRLSVQADRNEPLRYDLYLIFDKKHLQPQTFDRYVSDVFRTQRSR
ncbi:hypothetical protein M3Y94_00469000 [Aphelenchoides besseyi]|nr:hypothetical protein M3Y94_00469000 [Aphelenchoides besseyi]